MAISIKIGLNAVVLGIQMDGRLNDDLECLRDHFEYTINNRRVIEIIQKTEQ